MPLPTDDELKLASQSEEEITRFIESFAKVNVNHIRRVIGAPAREVSSLETGAILDWDDPIKLARSGITYPIDESVRGGEKYLHVDAAVDPAFDKAVSLFLSFTGLSDKLKRTLFPKLSANNRVADPALERELARLNSWLDWVRQGGFDPASFVTYQRSLGTHGQTQNLSGAIGAVGASIAFIDAIRSCKADAIISHSGALPPEDVRDPQAIADWRESTGGVGVKSLLLRNRRAIVFSGSKDISIFQPLGDDYISGDDVLRRYNAVRNDANLRAQNMHEFAVGEVKTATDVNNLHERMGLASRETQTELRTDRFLMMSVLNRDILSGGVQGRVMNNKDLTRFSQVFNLHHCWGWDGGRTRNPIHWAFFKAKVKWWCGL